MTTKSSFLKCAVCPKHVVLWLIEMIGCRRFGNVRYIRLDTHLFKWAQSDKQLMVVIDTRKLFVCRFQMKTAPKTCAHIRKRTFRSLVWMRTFTVLLTWLVVYSLIRTLYHADHQFSHGYHHRFMNLVSYHRDQYLCLGVISKLIGFECSKTKRRVNSEGFIFFPFIFIQTLCWN